MTFDIERSTRRRRVGAASLALLLSTAAVPALAQSAQTKQDVADFTLGNGMEVVVIPDHRAPIVTQMVWYKIGSADEPPGKSGIAHFFEHLMFKGTTNHKAGEFGAKVAEIGGSENAFTSYDYTAFYQTVSPDALETMMSFESDRMRNLILTDDVIGPEREVILEERRSRIEGSPEALLGEQIQATLYENHPYRIPVIGWMHEMEQLNRPEAIEFYNRYYAPNNAVLVVSGDVEPEKVREMAEKTYGKVARGPDLPPRVRPTEPKKPSMRTVTMSDERVTVPGYSKSWVVPSYHTSKNGEAEALDLLSEILGGGTRSRLYQQLIVKDGSANDAGASYDGASLDDTSFMVYGSPRDAEGLEGLETGIDAQIARIVKDGVSDEELQKSKKRYLRAMEFARDKPSAMANLYGAALATGSTVKDMETWPDRIRAVTAAQVQAVAAKYLNPDLAVVGYLLPKQGSAEPDTAEAPSEGPIPTRAQPGSESPAHGPMIGGPVN
ncbi:zinc protease [Mesorhizobium soli]|uniref:M16 family metallopeptidase n=1 Tax=Pseudaminobacter soli (ex Li et al. 2025) TaxID=1295366 RepID=UPI002476028B|nr:pitrilysin family protein [Mesorhizobium soli]MDH6229878.1 zinc protease [Mesorhizobium soli]